MSAPEREQAAALLANEGTWQEAVRYRIGWWLSEPFWQVYQFGLRSERVHARLIRWAEAQR